LKIQFDHISVKIFSDNDIDHAILSSVVMKSKLAFTHVMKKVKGFTVKICGDTFTVDLVNNNAVIGHKVLSEGRIRYFLRIIIDGFVLKNEGLPLHASLLSLEDKSLFLFGQSGSGKSLISKAILELNQEVKSIGDDHIIVTPLGFIGNSVFRYRSQAGFGDVYRETKNGFHRKTEYIVFDVDIHDKEERLEILSSDEYLKKDIIHILKYLITDLETETGVVKINDVFNFDIKSEYESRFSSFLQEADYIIIIRGSLEFVKSSIYSALNSNQNKEVAVSDRVLEQA